ncbi:MAG TPA: glycosyltransferase family 4 protein [Acidisarcina sp.]|nr:glycosyltransferase family 4 protein [Acidisarcina sp.]
MARKLRIGFVAAQDALDINGFSGSTFQMLSHIRQQDVTVEVYSPLDQSIKYLLAPVKAFARLRKKTCTLEHYPLVAKSLARQIHRLLRERPVDVLVASSSMPISALECEQPILFWTDAVFHDMYGYYAKSFANMTSAGVERAKRTEEAGLAHATYAVYGCDWAARTARKLTDPEKVRVLTFGPNLSIEHTAEDVKQWAEARRRERPHGCRLLFIGVDWSRKGGAIAVETARILNESGLPTTLTVVGTSPAEATPDYVETLGFISKSTPEGRARLAQLLREADFFILPTQAEATGIVFCEASAFGLPALSYATGGVPDYVRTGANGVCLPVGTPAEGFASAIRGILQTPDEYKALCSSAFHEYESRLNWDTSSRALVDLCRSAYEQRQNGEKRILTF